MQRNLYPFGLALEGSNDPVKKIDLHGLQGVDINSGLNLVMAYQYGTKEQAKAYHNMQIAQGVGDNIGIGLATTMIIGPTVAADAMLANPITTIEAGYGVGSTAIGIFDEGNQVQLPGPFDDAGRIIGKGVSNPIPEMIARVIPSNIDSKTLGKPGVEDVFVTAFEDIFGLNSTQISDKLTIPPSNFGFKVIKFRTPEYGLASPINRENIGFIGYGKTSGGAREFVIPNQLIPESAQIEIIK